MADTIGDFKKTIESKVGCAVIMAGSDSDSDHIAKLTDALDKYEIPHQVRICSAHKQPGTLKSIIDEYNYLRGAVAYVAVAGGTDALSGTLAFHAQGPVVSCPPDGSPNDPNMSCLTSPPGSSNVYAARPKNVARFIAQTFSHINSNYKSKLRLEKEGKIGSLEKADEQFRTGNY
tara:strand:- start:288 stop:812 length:525 start_codon:yes stop_codon:yes gene_type:complete